MGTTTNYGYNVPVGSDNVNLLPQMAANFPMIDSDLKAVSNTGVGTATELVTGTVHALTRADRDRNVFKFVATSNFEAGETFEVDGTQVTAKTPDGRNLSTGAYVINSTVLCMLEGTLLTVLVNPAKALDSENLDGHPATYFATAAALSALDNQLGAVSSKVGTGVLDVGNDCVDGINTLNTHLNDLTKRVATVTTTTPTTWRTILTTLASQITISNFNNKHAYLVVKVGTSYVYWTLESVTAERLDFINTECSMSSTKIIKLSVGSTVARVQNEITVNGWYTFDQLDYTVQIGVEIYIYMGN